MLAVGFAATATAARTPNPVAAMPMMAIRILPFVPEPIPITNVATLHPIRARSRNHREQDG
jgi:hypothetical protein